MRVLVTQAIDPVGLQILAEGGLDVELHEGEAPISRAELLARARGCVGLLAMPTDRVDGEVMDAGPLRVVANHAVGTDNLDLGAARARGVICTNTPGVLTEATADLTLALLLATARHVVAGDALVRSGGFRGWRPTMMRGLELGGATLGVVGYGRIGQAVAARARAFGMEVRWSGRASGVPLDELIPSVDVLSLHCPLGPATRHLLDARRLAAMKPGSILINTARGPIVDEAALAEALRAGPLGAAGLDVYEREPEVHPALLGLPNVVLLPHLGSATWRARREMARKAATNLVRALRGEGGLDRVGEAP